MLRCANPLPKLPNPALRQAGTPMQLTLLKAKIHRATVTEANLDYVGSITIDADLLDHPTKFARNGNVA